MAVQKSRVTPSRRGQRRSHDALTAKQLSTDDSPAFVNGVLAKIAELAPQVRAAQAAGSDGQG